MLHIVSNYIIQEGLPVSITNQTDIKELDVEWIDLILNARNLGFSMDDIRAFLRNAAHPAQNLHIPTKNEQIYVPVGFTGTAEV
jgi:hypothetical protein